LFIMPSTANRKPLLLVLVTGLMMTAWHEFSGSGRQAEPPTGATGPQDQNRVPMAGGGTADRRDARSTAAVPAAGSGRIAQAREEGEVRDEKVVSTVAQSAVASGRPAPLPWSRAARPKDEVEAIAGRKVPRAVRPGPPALAVAAAPDDEGDRLTEEHDAGAGPHEEGPPLRVPFSLIDPGQPATIPAVLAGEGPGTSLALEAAAEKAHLADAFIARVAEGSDDPRDPAYQRRWMEAQEESDVRMRASLGGHAWLTHHQNAHRGALEDQRRADASAGAGEEDDSPDQ
jgi:hypothetical protein